ncbi:MAG: hypothetical protein QW478_12720 [Candidatus Micrarchaeaceae archaeon]
MEEIAVFIDNGCLKKGIRNSEKGQCTDELNQNTDERMPLTAKFVVNIKFKIQNNFNNILLIPNREYIKKTLLL